MTYAATVIADSIAYGVRLTTIEVTFPRFILAEFNTHRMLSRNSASSRAIPVERRIEQVEKNPFVPESFTRNKRGMQADEALDEVEAGVARGTWLLAAQSAVNHAKNLVAVRVHKQHANRVIEPYAWHTVVVTATELENFWKLRISKNAQPEMFKTAGIMREVFDVSKPRMLAVGEWHLPYVEGQECCEVQLYDPMSHAMGCLGPMVLVKLSVARCAAVSYERQHADRPVEVLTERHDQLLGAGHMSPLEHQAQVVRPGGPQSYDPPFSPSYERIEDGGWRVEGYYCGNFRAPFLQYRKTLVNERVYRGE